MVRQGIDKICLAVHHQAKLIQSYCGNNDKYGASITYVLEDKLLSAMGSLKKIGGLPEVFYIECGLGIIILLLKNGWVIMRRKTIDTIQVLSDATKSILPAFSKRCALLSGLVKRASIVLLASQGNSTRRSHYRSGFIIIMLALGFLTAFPSFRKTEADDPEKVEDQIRSVLSDKKCLGASSVSTSDQKMRRSTSP